MKKLFFTVLLLLFFCCGLLCGVLFKIEKIDRSVSNLLLKNEKIKRIPKTKEQNNVFEIPEYPIDIEKEKCIASSDVYDYPDCLKQAEKAWDKEIQKYSDLLKEIMPADEYKYIAETDISRKKSFYNEIDIINRFISDKDGIIYQTEGYNDIVLIKRQYALILKSIYINYREEKEGIF